MHLIKARALHGRIDFHGLPISIETGRSRVRAWKNPHDGTEGMSLQRYAYGYFKGIPGVDGDALDVMVGPDTSATQVYVIHTMKAPDFQEYDEDKVVVQSPSADDARNAFLMSYSAPHFYGGMTSYSIEEFKAMVTAPDFTPRKLEKSIMKRFLTDGEMLEGNILEELGVNPMDIDMGEFRDGMKEEAEHSDVTGGDPIQTAKIVIAHLKDDRHYYSKMKAIIKSQQLKARAGIFY